ncbi:conserved hypothetical protein [Leishmania major strain Friedlin]|uniref:AAA+ ATPase domain-containing protein n=1 Tax=Leishmania major TaxID=5664 RepID=Q4QEE0_LEIMA|nr:conserved hypothetical protein [Leishmania major strain Friedlin]CAG9572279.1 ATPase_family_associated_with_various_cellular_activities_(AAA)_-_putative [Leishmania major strain Friedlin]CAJ03566.1 conserved hypothetical protein [Leishmania major strain Friedlin]|eukprot:XP_001682308.1 conserved hypothetical protein [Leishmania major strain Friedlin]
MDFEEAWREAMGEEQPPLPPPQQARGGHDGGGGGDDAYDEFSDEDLLRSVPCANDAAVAPVFGPVFSMAPVATAMTSAATAVPEFSSPRPAAASAVAAAMLSLLPSSGSQRGALEFPPVGVASFLLRGDNGRVRWVTTTGGAAASAAQRSGVRKIPQTVGHSHPREVVDVEAMEADDDVVAVHGDDEAATLCSSGAAMQPRDEDDEDDADDAAPSSMHRRASDPAGFLRDGLSARAMLRDIYAEEAKRQQQRVKRQENTEWQSVQRAAAGRDRCELEVLGDRDEVLDDEEREQRQFIEPARHCRAATAGTPARPRPHHAPSNGELWVTKYSPKLFHEVLSDETVNLRLLQWLKSWDAYVFPDDAPPAAKGAQASAAGATAAASPPAERIAVLTGPPGVGKTTLVHVLAAHCGYEVIEVNASVERTASRLEALIKTAVAAAGPAPGGCVRRLTASSGAAGSAAFAIDHLANLGVGKRHSGDASVAEVAAAAAPSSPHASSSLVQHLLRPKCLVIDEMDGIANSSVAAYLIQQQLHRPVFCLCNDFYVPSLRPLRQHCSHVYHMPPIRPQRLLSRLEEIAWREGATMFDSMALSELIKTSGGDVRSCLNAMQLISSAVHQQQQQRLDAGTGASSSATAAPAVTTPSRHTVTELIRRMQGKDTRVALRDSWQLLFTRPERNKAVQLLKQECGIDYEAFVEAAAAQHNRNVVPVRRALERERAIGAPTGGGYAATRTAETKGGGDASTRAAMEPVATGFRVDPGYLYAAQKLSRCPDSGSLMDGLQENYLNRAYTDYSFSRTSATADSFSQQDVVVAAAFQHPELMGTAERLCHVSALTCYVHCSTAARGSRIEFPREQATLRRLQSELKHVTQQFREGCRPHASAFLGDDEVVSTDVVPMLLRCLFDRSLRLPAHSISSFSRLPPAEQRLLQASVARHVEYGLDYQRDRQHTPSSATAAAGAAGASLSPFGSLAAANVEDEVPWRLAPELDRLLAGVVRPVEHALAGSGGGDYRGYSFSSRSSHFGGSGAGPRGGSGLRTSPSPLGAKSDAGSPGFATNSGGGGGGGGSRELSRRPSVASVMMPVRNEVRQILSGEIRQHRIMQSMELLKRQSQQSTTDALERGVKRQRAHSIASAATASSNPVHKADSTVKGDIREVEHATSAGGAEGVDAPVNKWPRADGTMAAPVTVTTITTVRRDFFGRPLPSTGSAGAVSASTGSTARSGRRAVGDRRSASATAATSPSSLVSPSSGDAGKYRFPRPHSPHRPTASACVRYVYQDGSTNAVKMPATFADF